MGLIAWYQLNGDTLDYSSYNRHGTNQGAQISSDSKTGRSYSFDGVNDTILCGVGQDFFPLPNFSISLWFQSLGTVPGTGTVPGLFGLTYGIRLMLNTNRIEFGLDDGSGFSTLYIDLEENLIGDGKWHHAVITATDSLRELYLDGVLLGTLEANWTGETRWPTNGFYIGRDNNNVNYFFKGFINDFRIYDHILSVAEIKELQKVKILDYKFDSPLQAYENILSSGGYSVYNNFGVSASVVNLGTKFEGHDIYRLTMTPTAASLSSFQETLHSKGVMTSSLTFAASTKYAFTVLWKPVTHASCRVGGTASNISGWTEIEPQYYKDGWTMSGQYRDGSVSTARTDRIFTSFYTPEAKVGEPISIDFCYMKLVAGTIYPFNDIPYGNAEEVVVPDNSGFLNSSILSKTISPQWVASVDGRPAYSFNGVNQVIRSNRRFYTPVNQLTLAGWVYPTGTHANDRGIIIQQNFNFYLTLTPDQKVSTYWYQTSPEGYHTTDVSVPLNQWSLVVAVWDGERHQIFLNSEKVLDKAVTTPGRNTSSDNNITVGGEGSTSGRYFNGFIAEVKIYGSALSEQDIKNLYILKMAVDHKHQLLLKNAQESVSKRETSNLILNGFGEYEDNTNFTSLNYIPNTDLPGVKGVFQRTGGSATVYFSNLIPVNSSDQYYLEHWARVVTGETGVRYYSTVMCYDSNKRGIVNPNFNIISSNCNTTLAQPLKPGDTVAHIANGSAWASLNPSVSPRVYLAMATDPAYPNYSYMPDYARVSSISGTTLTLVEAWSGEEIPTGMPVTATRDGSTYVYSPASNALLYSTWTRRSSNPVFRTGTKYVRIGLLANYSGTTSSTSVQYGGFLMKNISGAQNLETTSLFQIDRNTLKVNEIHEIGRPIRYIRDSINGSTSNKSNHWALIKAINRVGENIAIDKAIYGPTVVNPPNIHGLNVVLRDSISSSPYIESSNYCIVDLGEITEIVSIGIWHYYADGRTYYDNKVEVSIDGENWDTVFDNTGKTGYRETSAGNQIILQNPHFNIDKDGGIRTKEIKEVF